jgi:hypothetical protein
MPEEKKEMTKEEKFEKAKALVQEIQELELSEEELGKLSSAAGDSERLYIFGGNNGRPLNE